MPVSGNEETAIKSLGGKSSLHVAGVPMKKRRFIWPSSPTPEEQSLSQVENVAVEKQHFNPSQESAAATAVSSLGLSDSNKSSSLEENKKGSENVVPTNISINNPSFRIQEANLAIQFDSLGKSYDDEKLAVAEKSANVLTAIKPLGGVPMKKRRFVRPSSPPHENPSFMLVSNDSIKKEHDRLSLETAPSSASVGGSSSGPSDVNKKDVPEKNRTSDNMVQTSVVYHSRVKMEEACPVAQSDSLVKLDNTKLLTPEKCVNVIVKSADTELNLAPSKILALNVGNEQIAEGKSKVKSIGSGNHELSLGLTGSQLSAPEDQSRDSSWNQGNIESFSLNLSSSSGDRNSHFKMDQVQSNTGSGNVFTDRLKWDLNTTMDAWEASVHDGAAGQVVPDGSNIVDTRNDEKPLMSIGVATTSIATEKHLFDETECRTSFSRTLSETGQPYSSEDSLHLRLSPYSPLFNRLESSDLSAKDSCIGIPNISSPKELLLGSQTVNSRTIKSEPVEESEKHGSSGSKANPMLLLGSRAVSVKSEYVEKPAQEALNLPNSSPQQSMKSARFNGNNLETLKTTTEGMSQQSDKEVVQSQDARGQSTSSMSEHVLQGRDIEGQSTCLINEHMLQVQNTTGQSNGSTNEDVLQGQVTGGQSNCSTDEQMLQGSNIITKPSCSIGLSVHVNGLDHLVHGGLAGGAHVSNEAPKKSCESAEEVASEMGSLPVGHSGDGINGSSGIGAMITEEKSADISDQLKLKSKDELAPDPHQIGECTVSEEEKINLSGDILEEDSYGSEFESDGNSIPMDIEEDGRGQDDYEDGEFREPQPHDAVEGPICEKTEDASHGDSEDKKANSEELHGDLLPSSSDVEGKNSIKEQLVEAKEDAVVDVDATLVRNTIDAVKDSLEESSEVEISSNAADERKVVKTIQREFLDLSAIKENCLGSEQSSDQPASGGQGTFIGAAQGTSENAKMSDVEKGDSASLMVDTSINVDDAAKDANSGGNQSRIINLSIPSNMSSFGKARTISGKPLPLRPGRERLPDIPLEGERLHLRGREEAYTEGSHKFSRERYQDQSSRNSRWNFVHGRGRIGSRIDSMRNDRDPDRDCVPRHKYTSAATGSDTEYMNYNVGQDGAFVNNVRGGRKLLDDETPLFRQLSSRRRSPGARDGPASRGLQMVRRVPRNIGEDNSEVVGLRHAEKIMRGFPDDGEEQHVYTRPQPPYEGLDGRFVQGTRNFSNVQRRGMPQMRSKSPIRSRSPGPWSSRRRSPDGFGGPPELPHRRSPIYRMERIRSPNNPGFPTDRVPRRHGSPSYMTRPNELREMDPGRDHGHPRPIISNRTPNGRVLLRNNRRFNIVDPRERAENDEFFGGPVHSGRFHELGGDGNGEERRRFDERRAHVRPFRPPFNGADGENFHINAEDGPRSFRYFQEDNPEFHEQRSREFDRRIKNRPGNGPRRPRSIEEQEGNYRHGGQVMYDDGFDDMSRVKRKRF
ncbi:uncharacterized protein [Euphorbia lathyris]|uniref:uncharacterized protein n=1 Tax=Euphorbia lathyris TaxID=212925 RepID=UPI00331436C3